tara:strand:- start:696 stop:1094 length:399 start_codon:yes stop_codon:yes gene_type:complete
MPEVTLVFVSILSSFMILLSLRVLDLRGSPVTKFLHKPNRVVDKETLQRSIRGHGNLIEYAPLFLILMLVLELSGAPQTQLYFAGIIFTVGRLMHGIVFSFMKYNMFLRIGGMTFTFVGFLVLIKTSIMLLL